MNTKTDQTKNNQGDTAKLFLAGIILLAGFVAYYWFADAAQSLRWGMVVGGIVLATVVAYFTRYGDQARHFFVETRFEVRKIVWPTRDETVKTTAMVLVVVILIAALLGLIDLILKSVVLDWLLG